MNGTLVYTTLAHNQFTYLPYHTHTLTHTQT